MGLKVLPGGGEGGDDEPDAVDDLAEWRSERNAVRAAGWAPPLVPPRFAGASLADLDDELRSECERWLHSTPHPNLVLFGPVGVGKTHAALSAAREAWVRWQSVAFRPVSEMLDALRPGGSEDPEALAAVDVLVLDDVGAEKMSEWTSERVFTVVNRRWMDCRPIVATSNLEPRALASALGERTYSRLVGSGAVVIVMRGANRRQS